jgi:hypothetical protein
MDNSEEYVLQVFRRAQSMLEGDVKPEHVPYLLKLGQKFAQTIDLRTEVVCLNFIQGFSKAGIAFEWLLARSKRDTEFSLEQFDTDVQLLYDALLDAFNADNFDPFNWEEPQQTPSDMETARALPEPNWNHAPSVAADTMPVVVQTEIYDTPSFADLLDHPMLLTVRRLADSAVVFDQKTDIERATSLAVLKMMAKNVVDMARPQNKVVVTGTFYEIASIIESIERKGLVKDKGIAAIITQLGSMLSFALRDVSSGIRYMQEITEFIHESKDAKLK